MEAELWLMLWTAIAAAASAALGYAKTAKKKEGWDWYKAARTVLLAAAVSLVGSYSGLGPDAVMASPAYAWLSVQLENALKWTWRHLLGKK